MIFFRDYALLRENDILPCTSPIKYVQHRKLFQEMQTASERELIYETVYESLLFLKCEVDNCCCLRNLSDHCWSIIVGVEYILSTL